MRIFARPDPGPKNKKPEEKRDRQKKREKEVKRVKFRTGSKVNGGREKKLLEIFQVQKGAV